MDADAASGARGPMLDIESLRRLERLARRLSHRADEAEDLLQDAMLAAVQAGRCDEPWLHGVMRRRAAFLARGAGRRLRREAIAADTMAAEPDEHPRWPEAGCGRRAIDVLLRRLPPASRRVLLLAMHGLGAGEIQWLLRTTPAAFRQRVAVIRREVRRLPAALRMELDAQRLAGTWPQPHDPHFGLRRRALVAAGARVQAAGIHDPDGHLLLLRPHAHVPAPVGN